MKKQVFLFIIINLLTIQAFAKVVQHEILKDTTLEMLTSQGQKYTFTEGTKFEIVKSEGWKYNVRTTQNLRIYNKKTKKESILPAGTSFIVSQTWFDKGC